MSDDLCSLTLSEAAEAIKTKYVTSVKLTKACLSRIESLDSNIKSIAAIDPDKALASAHEADKALANGDAEGLLHGVPLAHKDMFYRAGRISGCGSKIRANFVPDKTGSVLERFDRSGALDIARLNMVEFALGVTGHNKVMPTPRNPWNTDYITGGSSSGSGAAVSSRLIFGAMGSDTGGSIRFPSCCNGITGLKPTSGRVSRFGTMPLSASLDTLGPMARTAKDTAIMLQAIAGHDARDPTSSRLAVPNYLSNLGRGIKGLRIAIPENYFYDPVAPEIADIVGESLKVFRSGGAEIVPVVVPDSIALTNPLTSMIAGTEGASIHQKWLQQRPNDYGTQTKARLNKGLLIPATRYLQAKSMRAPVLKEFCKAVFDKADVLHCPVMVSAVPSICETDFSAAPGFSNLITAMGHCTRPFNFMGLPSLTIPCGFTSNGLPTAFQIVGKPFDESTLFRAGHAYQKLTDWHEQAPNI